LERKETKESGNMMRWRRYLREKCSRVGEDIRSGSIVAETTVQRRQNTENSWKKPYQTPTEFTKNIFV